MKRRKAFKLALLCLGVGLAVGLYYGRVGRAPARAAAADYADEAPDFDSLVAKAPALAPAGEVVVDFRDDVDEATVASIGRALSLRFHAASVETARDRVFVGEIDPARERAALESLRADARVESAEEDLVLGVPEQSPGSAISPSEEGLRDTSPAPARGPFPNDPRAAEQWHMGQIHMPETWPAATGAGVIVAVIDTGVSRVEDLADTAFVPGWNFVANNDQTDDDHGHGTHVAGTIAQSTHNGIGVTGVAYGATIMPLKVLSASGSGSVAGIAQAVRWAADHGAKVINMSLGGPLNAQVLANAIRYAHEKGVVVICAAGNDGRGKVSFPAANKGSVAIAATQQDEKTTFYSNWGKQVAIAAPGGNTRESPAGGVLQNTRYQGKDDYYFFMGTSMAAPHAAGVAALVESQGVTDPDAVLAVLRSTARAPEGMTTRPADFAAHYGAGIIDAKAAVAKAALGHGGLEAGLGGALALAAALMLRRSKRAGALGLGGVLGVAVGASGLFFLPFVLPTLAWLPTHVAPSLAGTIAHVTAWPGAALAVRGFPAWDEALLGAAGHGNPLFYSALAPIGLLALFYGIRRGRGLLAGFAFGVAGHLLAQVVLPTADIRFMPLHALGSLWLCANAALSAFAGWLALRR